MVPSRAFDVETLAWFARRFDPSLAIDGIWHAADWRIGREAVESVFSLDRSAHFLRHHQGLLPQLWERQITRALRAMLIEDPDRTLERCQALLTALTGPAGPVLSQIDLITADDADRLDLAVHFRTVDNFCGCIVIEAKLESELSDTQLEKYQASLRKRYAHRKHLHLWVVAPTRTARTNSVLDRKENAEWKFSSWRRLLINWQRALPEDPGADVLSIFSEIWKRVGGR